MSHTTYLVASLPLLRFGDAPPTSVEDFRFHCQGVLGVADLTALDLVLSMQGAHPPWEELQKSPEPFVREFAARELQLRNACARIRALAWGPEGRFTERSHSGFDGRIARTLADAASKDPLQREQDLDLCRWAMAEELAQNASFTLAAVLAYAIKLGILKRWAALDEQAGQAKLTELIHQKDTQSWQRT